jgi:hypothetical protein
MRSIAAAGLLGALLVAGCGDDEDSGLDSQDPEAIASRIASCDNRLGPAIGRQPPKVLPRPTGAIFDNRSVAADATTWTGYVPGNDPIAVRDAIIADFRKAKLKVSGVGTRGDEGQVGTFAFAGPRSGIVIAAQLCTGQIRLGYTVRK